MRIHPMVQSAVAVAMLAFAATVAAQEVKAYKEGPVTSLSCARCWAEK